MTTKDKIIELGRDYVQRLGYHSFKYQLIANDLNIKNAAIHHYFPAKEDLGVAIIEKDRSDFKLLTESIKKHPLKDQAEALLTLYINYYNQKKNLCIVGACVSAFAELPEKMALASQNHLETIQTWLINLLKQGQASGEFRFKEKPEDLAALWISALPGALQSAQIKGEAHLMQVITQLRQTLKTQQPT
ncbi:MAG: TetR/AcrR family transcriptional regulator [Bacteroidetes bacterium]|nr:TetR/AcrR family transcriptional regulator [Bacteroidota bacterium]